MNAPAAAAGGTTQSKGSWHHWPITYLVVGILMVLVGLGWGWSVQILTSESWFNHSSVSVSLLPHFGVFMQPINLFTQTLSVSDIMTYTWGWGVQIVQLFSSLGLEWPKHNRWLDIIFGLLTTVTVALNVLSDIFYGSGNGIGQGIGFAFILFIMAFGVGKFGIHYVVRGVMGLLGH